MSAIGAVLVIWHNGRLARRRATIDHILNDNSNAEYLEAIQLLYSLDDKQVRFTKYFETPECAEFKAIRKVMNKHEFIALGIRTGAFEERIYKELQYSNFMKVYHACSACIAEVRSTTKKQTLFQEFEWLAKRWERTPLKKHT